MTLGFGGLSRRWVFWVQTKARPKRHGRVNIMAKPEGKVIELQGEVTADIQPTEEVRARMENLRRGRVFPPQYTFADMTDDDLRALAAAFLRGEVMFSGGRYTRLPVFWQIRRS